ncbi:MAG: HEAT repeat domain-containing protein [Fuerstiella sp.]
MNSFRIVILMFIVSGSSTFAALKSTKVPRYDAAVAKSVAWLTGNPDKIGEREKTLAAYALLKAGIDPGNPLLREGIAIAKDRADNGGYAKAGYDHIYLAGVDSMLLADSDADLHFASLQLIADYVQAVQRADGSWSDGPAKPGDVSMSQYGVLALWSAQRAGCKVSPDSLDRAASFFLRGRNPDGGWGYRPGTTEGPGRGASTHNMTLAGAGSVAVVRTLVHGPKGYKAQDAKEETKKFGVLEKVTPEAAGVSKSGSVFPGYNAKNSAGTLDDAVGRGLAWNQSRFSPVSQAEHKIYFYYALERASALADLPEGWYTTYGDGLLTLQGQDGSFATFSGPVVGTSFAILYFMRSTQQILDKVYSGGVMSGGRDPESLFGDKKKPKREMTSLDVLLGQLEKADLDALDDISAEEVVEAVQFGSREELVGQVDLLKKLIKHKDADNRRAAYFALGRTGDFSLIPEILKGLRDPNVDVNVEALQALRYIARKPLGFGISLNPLEGAETADDQRKVEVANAWRTKAFESWMTWYRQVRPYEQRGGLDELEAMTRKR